MCLSGPHLIGGYQASAPTAVEALQLLPRAAGPAALVSNRDAVNHWTGQSFPLSSCTDSQTSSALSGASPAPTSPPAPAPDERCVEHSLLRSLGELAGFGQVGLVAAETQINPSLGFARREM